MLSFKLRPHSTREGDEMVEIVRDGMFVGALYPEAGGVRFVSAYDGSVQAVCETGSIPVIDGGDMKRAQVRLRRIDIGIGEARLDD